VLGKDRKDRAHNPLEPRPHPCRPNIVELRGVIPYTIGAPRESEEALPAGVDVYLSDDDRSMADAAGVDLRQLVARALRDTEEQLSLEQTTIRMVVDPREVSARLGGVRRFTNPGTGIIDVWLNLDGPDSTVRNRITQNLPITLAHELHHSVRILRGPGYGLTLGQALVTEGLPCRLRTTFIPTDRSRYRHLLTRGRRRAFGSLPENDSIAGAMTTERGF
jgi:hypothetical protein